MFNRESMKILQIFKTKFSKELRLGFKSSSECLLLLILGLFAQLDTVNALRKHLGVPKDQFYRSLQSLSVCDWKKLFTLCFDEFAIDALLKLQNQSAASWSNAFVQLSVDDSVVRKYSGKSLSFMGKWFSGQLKRVVKGYDVLLIVLTIKDMVIPVGFHIYSKKDQKASRVVRMAKMLAQLSKRWQQAGIDIGRIAVTADNGYCSGEFAALVQQAGFKKIVAGASKAWVVSDEENSNEEETYKLGEILTIENLKKANQNAWAIPLPVLTAKVYHAELGKILVIARKAAGKIRMAMGIGVDRDAELYRIWIGHYKIEQLFRLFKSRLSWGKARLRGKKGAMATIVIPFLAYAVLLEIKKSLKRNQITFYMIADTFLNRWFTDFENLFLECQLEHFNIRPPSSDQMLGIGR